MSTYMDKLIERAVENSMAVSISRATEKIAEDIAKEMLKDPKFRARLQESIDRFVNSTIAKLDNPVE